MQGLAINAVEWAREFFDFAGQKAAEKLQKYLHLQEVQELIPSFDSVSHAEQHDCGWMSLCNGIRKSVV